MAESSLDTLQSQGLCYINFAIDNSPSHDGDFDDLGINALRSPSLNAELLPSPSSSGPNTLPSATSDGGLEDIDMDALRSPLPDAELLPLLPSANILAPPTPDDDLEDIGIDALRSPSPEAELLPSPPGSGANALPPLTHDDDLGINTLRSPSPDAELLPSPPGFSANALSLPTCKSDPDQNTELELPHPLEVQYPGTIASDAQAGGPLEIVADRRARADGSSAKARSKPHICVYQLPSSYAR
jgi:hypothetical protein